MIKIFLNQGYLNQGYAAWEKDNKRYTCIRKFNGKKSIYDQKIYILYVADVAPSSKIEIPVKTKSLADLNKWLEKTEVEIEEN